MGDSKKIYQDDVILDEQETRSESEDFSISQSNKDALKDIPEVLSFINRLQECILRQRTLIHRLYQKFKEERNHKTSTNEVSTQTSDDDLREWISTAEPAALVEDIKKAAEDAVQQSGFVYEETSGMYYDYNTGYYYNAEHGLYYNGQNGAYYYFDETTKTFHFHSQVDTHEAQPQVDHKEEQSSIQTNPSQMSQSQIDANQQPNSNSYANQSSYSENSDAANHNLPLLPLSTSDSSKDLSSKEITLDPNTSAAKRSYNNTTKIKKKIKLEGKEEGECSESSSESDQDDNDMIESDKKQEQIDAIDNSENKDIKEEDTSVQVAQNPILDSDEIAAAWPPCLRVVVMETALDDLPVGSLFIVTCTGGSVGREGDHSILIPDINISKQHAKLNFCEEEKTYMIVDLGSRNGTFVDGKRVSVALQESEPVPVSHGTELRLGSTRLQCHVHPGYDTCDDCEPGCIQHKKTVSLEITDKDKGTREARHRSELRRLRKRFGLDKLSTKETNVSLADGYQDRAEVRRKTVGSQNHHAKTETASVHESIKSTNKGFKMLSKMGWAKGQSLGKDSTKGITEPVNVEQRADKAGLGSEATRLPAVDPQAKKRADIWKKAQKRFQELNDDSGDEDVEAL